MIDFILNNQRIKTAAPPGTAVLDFVRKQRQLTGMKLVCKEGECGACTMLVGEWLNDRMIYKSMTSCIMPLVNAHGKHLLTIEGLSAGDLTPIQQAMIDTTGTQCGFCTPGFVVSMTGALLNSRHTNTENFLEAIDGNICRCTGYKSIERAIGKIVDDLREKQLDNDLLALINANYLPAYLADIPTRLKAIASEFPKANTDAKAIRLGGGTDLYVQRPNEMYEADINPVFSRPDMREIKIENGVCTFGAALTMGDLYHSPTFQKALPNSDYLFRLLSSTQIRNMATIGGNLVNASPIGDFTILLLGLNAAIELRKERDSRWIDLKDFYLDYKKMDLQEGEYLMNIRFQLPENPGHFYFDKISQRKYLDIAGVNSAMTLRLEEDKTIAEMHLSAGGVGPIPQYLTKTIESMLGQQLTETLLDKALQVLQSEISPISDARGSADYKRMALRQLVIAHFLKVDENIYPVEKLIGA